MVVLFFKKGNKILLKNYPSISLLRCVNKLYRVIANRLMRWLDHFQLTEQVGFRGEFGTKDHIHTVRQMIMKTQEYNHPLCLAFVESDDDAFLLSLMM